MLKIKRQVWVLVCVFFLGGCALPPGKDKPGLNAGAKPDAQHTIIDAGRMYQSGRSHQEQNNYSQALAAYKKTLAVDPDYVEAHNGLGVVYSLQGQHELALQHLQMAISLAPMASHLHNNLGYAYLLQGRASEAANAFEQSLRLDPKNQEARSNLAVAYERMGCIGSEPCGRWQDPNLP